MNKQTARLLEQHFDTAFAAPDGIAKLRELILTLAMQGRLVEQDPNDPPVSELLKEIKTEKEQLVKAGKIKKPKPLPPIKPEEVPYELPKGWEWVRLGEVLSFEYGNNLPAKKRSNSGEFPVYGSNGIVGTHKEAFVNKFCIVIGRKGSAGALNLCLSEGCCVTDVAYYCIPPKEIDLYFCFNLLHILKLNSLGKGIKPGLNRNEVYDLAIAIPPLSEQFRIVAKIDQLMKHCDELETLHKEREEKRLAIHAAAIKQLFDAPDGLAWNFIQQHFGELYTVKENVAELRKAILQLAVMGRLVPQNPDDPPAGELLKEIKEEKQRLVKAKKIKKPKPISTIIEDGEPFPVPDNWRWVRIAELAESIDYGTSQKTCDDTSLVPVYRMGNIVDGQLIDQRFKYISPDIEDLPRLFLQPNDILFNRTNSYELVGKNALYSGSANHATFASYLIRIRLLDALMNPLFISQAMNAPYFRLTQIEPEIVQQCGQANFNGTKLSLCAVPFPPLPEQHRIVARVDQLMALCDTLEKQIDNAAVKQTEMLNAVMARVGG
jgi:type I restriction enzyme S subunit